MCVCVCVCVCASEIREEDNADKPVPYIENCIGMGEPVTKVKKLIFNIFTLSG